MIAFLDVYYREEHAIAAAILAEDWASSEIIASWRVEVAQVGDYQPGSFHLRELRPLVAVIALIDQPVETYVIDAYCQLSVDGTPGLGARLAAELGTSVPIVGIAKNRYQSSRHAVEVHRGGSRRSLFVTAIGLDPAFAADQVAAMSGNHRIPTLLQKVDHLSRGHDDSGRVIEPQ